MSGLQSRLVMLSNGFYDLLVRSIPKDQYELMILLVRSIPKDHYELFVKSRDSVPVAI